MFSFELLAYRELVNSRAMPGSVNPAEKLPEYFLSADDIGPKEHVDIQAAAQLWVGLNPFRRRQTCPRITSTRISRISTCMPSSRA